MAQPYISIPTNDEEKVTISPPHEHIECSCTNKNKSIFRLTPLRILLALALCPLLYGICTSHASVTGWIYDIDSGSSTDSISSQDELPMCESATALGIAAPKKNIFRNLNEDEAQEIRKWLFSEEQGLNLTLTGEAGSL